MTFDQAEIDLLFSSLRSYDRVIVAVSGGSDSLGLMLLLRLWCDYNKRDKLPHFIIATVNHGLRPTSSEEARFVATRAEQLGFKHETVVWDHDLKLQNHNTSATKSVTNPATNIEQRARIARYSLLIDLAVRLNCQAIITAHHLNDQVETFMLRLAKGSGVYGLAAMSEVSDLAGIKLLRPLLTTDKSRLTAFLKANGQTWREDDSNYDQKFARVKIRKLMPIMAGADIKAGNIATSINKITRAAAALTDIANERLTEMATINPFGFITLRKNMLVATPLELAAMILSRCLLMVGGKDKPVKSHKIDQLYSRLVDDAGFIPCTLAGCKVTVNGNNIIITKEFGRYRVPPLDCDAGGAVLFDRRFIIYMSENNRLMGNNQLRLESGSCTDGADPGSDPGADGKAKLKAKLFVGGSLRDLLPDINKIKYHNHLLKVIARYYDLPQAAIAAMPVIVYDNFDIAYPDSGDLFMSTSDTISMYNLTDTGYRSVFGVGFKAEDCADSLRLRTLYSYLNSYYKPFYHDKTTELKFFRAKPKD